LIKQLRILLKLLPLFRSELQALMLQRVKIVLVLVFIFFFHQGLWLSLQFLLLQQLQFLLFLLQLVNHGLGFWALKRVLI
jgi:hypothetical protein